MIVKAKKLKTNTYKVFSFKFNSGGFGVEEFAPNENYNDALEWFKANEDIICDIVLEQFTADQVVLDNTNIWRLA